MKFIRYQKSPLFTPSHHTTLRNEIDRLFDAAVPALSSLQRINDWQGAFPVDLYQDKNAVTVRAELPGFRKEDIAVEVEDDVLTITGQQKTEAKAEAKDTAPTRKFSRAIALPENLDLDKIQAVYENGVLTVTLPKREEVKPRQITVDVK